MLPPRLQSVAASLILHAGLFSLAAVAPSAPAPLPIARRAALEASIAIETEASEKQSAAVSTSAEAAALSSAVAAPRARPAAVQPREQPVQPRTTARGPAGGVAGLRAPAAAPIQPTTRVEGAAPVGVEADVGAASAEPNPASHGEVPGGPAPSSGIAASASPGAGAVRAEGVGPARGPGAHPQLLARYLERVRARVAEHREYPYVARRANLEGTICLRVSIAASGSVLGVTPTCGTSHEPLLQAALRSVSSAAPFPPLPALLGARLTLDVPVVFELDSL